MNDSYENCDRCGNPRADQFLHSISIRGEKILCAGCLDALIDFIEYHNPQDLWTENIHQDCVDWLAGRDEIQCVISSYESATVIVHTPYVSSDVIQDCCEHYGLTIAEFGPLWEQETALPCIEDGTHGSTFEITMVYDGNSGAPLGPEIIMNTDRIDEIDDTAKQF